MNPRTVRISYTAEYEDMSPSEAQATILNIINDPDRQPNEAELNDNQEGDIAITV
jgi:hypothetical protein